MMNGAPIRTRIVNAREQSLAEINRLIARSKSNWNWPKGYLDSALPLHRVNSVYLRSNHCFEVLDALDNLIAFFSVVVGEARVVLDNLWVTPPAVSSGSFAAPTPLQSVVRVEMTQSRLCRREGIC
jgi:hypothetical protein